MSPSYFSFAAPICSASSTQLAFSQHAIRPDSTKDRRKPYDLPALSVDRPRGSQGSVQYSPTLMIELRLKRAYIPMANASISLVQFNSSELYRKGICEATSKHTAGTRRSLTKGQPCNMRFPQRRNHPDRTISPKHAIRERAQRDGVVLIHCEPSVVREKGYYHQKYRAR